MGSRVYVAYVIASERNCDRMSQRIEERFVRDPEGESGPRA